MPLQTHMHKQGHYILLNATYSISSAIKCISPQLLMILVSISPRIAKAKMEENKEQRIESLLEFPHNYSSVALDSPAPPLRPIANRTGAGQRDYTQWSIMAITDITLAVMGVTGASYLTQAPIYLLRTED